MQHRVTGLVAVLALALPAGAACAEEFYYVMIFGSEDHPKHFRFSHTWATFASATGEGPDPASYAVEAHTISWMPETLDVRVLRLRPERGVNLTLEQSLGMAAAFREGVTMWGPFRVRPEIYERSLRVHAILDSDAAQYRAISGPGNLLISDCIHAVAAVDPTFGRGHYPLIRIGKPASRYIAHEVVMRSAFAHLPEDHSWLIPRLGLDRYPIEVVPPRSIPPRPCGLCRHPE